MKRIILNAGDQDLIVNTLNLHARESSDAAGRETVATAKAMFTQSSIRYQTLADQIEAAEQIVLEVE